jgi:chromosome segregation ATPase
MNKLVILITVFAVVFSACDSKEKAQMQSELDSLRRETVINQQLAEVLMEVGDMMDSIDASRNMLRMSMIEGTSYDDFRTRMNELNQYVKTSESRLTELEQALRKSQSTSGTYANTIKKLRADLESRNKEIAELRDRVEQFRNTNQNLVNLVALQESELEDKEGEIMAKNQELAFIEARIQELMLQFKMSEADAYFARAQAVEEAANRTKLAPRKKKETLEEALELYRKSYSLGNNEAKSKIDELSAKL